QPAAADDPEEGCAKCFHSGQPTGTLCASACDVPRVEDTSRRVRGGRVRYREVLAERRSHGDNPCQTRVVQDSLRDLSGRILLGDGHPRDGGIAPEPRELAFRKVAGVPLQAPDGLLPSVPAPAK